MVVQYFETIMSSCGVLIQPRLQAPPKFSLLYAEKQESLGVKIT